MEIYKRNSRRLDCLLPEWIILESNVYSPMSPSLGLSSYLSRLKEDTGFLNTVVTVLNNDLRSWIELLQQIRAHSHL